MRTILFLMLCAGWQISACSEAKANSNPYTRSECVKDVFDYVWSDVLAGKKASPEKLNMQTSLVQLLITNAKLKDASGGAAAAFNNETLYGRK